MKRAPGFIIDVPITLSVAVRGVSQARAEQIARDFADGLDPTDDYVRGYMDEKRRQGVEWEITEVSLESPTDESCELLEELEEDDEGEDEGEDEDEEHGAGTCYRPGCKRCNRVGC